MNEEEPILTPSFTSRLDGHFTCVSCATAGRDVIQHSGIFDSHRSCHALEDPSVPRNLRGIYREVGENEAFRALKLLGLESRVYRA